MSKRQVETRLQSEVLRAAADKIRPVGAWCQGSVALDASGRSVSSDNPAAVCWCTLGALWSIAGNAFSINCRYLLAVGGGGTFNDDKSTTQSEAVGKLLEAAQLAESDGQ